MTKPYSRRDFFGVALAAGVLPKLPAAVHAASPAPKHFVGVDQRGKFPAGLDPYSSAKERTPLQPMDTIR
jgi:hypothetical protein